MLDLLGGGLVFVFGVAVLLGAIVYLVSAVFYFTPAVRVRYADREIRSATPFALRWFRMTGGRRVHTRSQQRRAGTRSNSIQTLWVGFLMVVVPATGLWLMTVALSLDRGSPGPWFEIALFAGAAAGSGYSIRMLSRAWRRLRRERRRLRAATAAETTATDERPPIVLLRAFSDDGRQVALFDEKALPVTLEETLAARLGRHGPVIAVGTPGEPLPPVGASREYLSSEWRGRVSQLIDEAGVIVVLLGRTSGLLWEIEQVFLHGREHRLVIVVPDEEADALEERWNAVRQVVEGCRPELGDDRLAVTLRHTLAIVFDTDLRPRRIIGRQRARPYYRDAIENAVWFVETWRPARLRSALTQEQECRT